MAQIDPGDRSDFVPQCSGDENIVRRLRVASANSASRSPSARASSAPTHRKLSSGRDQSNQSHATVLADSYTPLPSASSSTSTLLEDWTVRRICPLLPLINTMPACG